MTELDWDTAARGLLGAAGVDNDECCKIRGKEKPRTSCMPGGKQVEKIHGGTKRGMGTRKRLIAFSNKICARNKKTSR